MKHYEALRDGAFPSDMLRLSYIVDLAVQGATTLRTAKPIPRSAVLPALTL